MRENPNLDLPTRSRTEYFWSCRAESWDKTEAETEFWSLIPTMYNRDLRSRWQGSQFSNGSLPICGAPKNPCKNAHVSSKVSFTCMMAATPTKGRKFFLVQLSFYRCRSASLLDAAITYRFTPKRGKERDQEADCIPADYPSQVKKWLHCIWALRQYSGKQIANDNLAHAHAHSASPPCYNTVAFQIVLLGWGFKAGK